MRPSGPIMARRRSQYSSGGPSLMSFTTGRGSGLGAEGATAVRLAAVHGIERAALQLGEVRAAGSRRLAKSSQAEVHRPRQQSSAVPADGADLGAERGAGRVFSCRLQSPDEQVG